MADFYSTNKEEMLIHIVRKDGFGYDNDNELPKYIILRLALSKALLCVNFPLHSDDWNRKILGGDRGKEYNLEQITGKGKNNGEDIDLLLRAIFYVKHKDELERDGINIFENDKKYLEILEKYIKRGLYEIQHSWKSKDCFYQWCLDNLSLNKVDIRESLISSDDYFTTIQIYFRKRGIAIEHISSFNSFRHIIYKIKLKDSMKITAFEKESKNLDRVLGENAVLQSLGNLEYNIAIPKPKEKWHKLGNNEYKKGLLELDKYRFELGIFAGFTFDRECICFDLKDTPHLFVAGTTGSGKTSFLCVMIHTLLRQNNVEIIIIDPKHGLDYKPFKDRAEIIADTELASEKIEQLVEIMEERYEAMSNGKDFKYIVCFIDELNDLLTNNSDIGRNLMRLAIKARQSKIHLVLGTQRPDMELPGSLRSNVPSRIALKVNKGSDSKIILDEHGAEKLLGAGDMLVKIMSYNGIKHVFGVDFREIV